jgi:hypothetical protein
MLDTNHNLRRTRADERVRSSQEKRVAGRDRTSGHTPYFAKPDAWGMLPAVQASNLLNC